MSNLNTKSLKQLKSIAADLGVTPSGDKRYKSSWRKAIMEAQAKNNIVPAKNLTSSPSVIPGSYELLHQMDKTTKRLYDIKKFIQDIRRKYED